MPYFLHVFVALSGVETFVDNAGFGAGGVFSPSAFFSFLGLKLAAAYRTAGTVEGILSRQS
jgi:cobalamin biosynthesis protein CobD/CbiB